jgi:type IV pilus assembly protein PilN
MQLELNLATHPFGHRRLFWVSTGAAALTLFGFAALLVAFYVRNHEPAPQFVQREARLRDELRALQTEEAELKRKLSLPENEQVLDRSLFLNQLLHRKGISWTKTFADLEEIFPPRVRVEQLRPQVTPDNRVFLDMTVGAETPADFIELIKALENSNIFEEPELRGEAPPTEQDPVFKYLLSVRYDQQFRNDESGD